MIFVGSMMLYFGKYMFFTETQATCIAAKLKEGDSSSK